MKLRPVLAGLATTALLVAPAIPAQAISFNIPSSAGGTKTTADSFNHQMRLEIDRAKAGDDLTLATYGLSNWEVHSALVRAIARHVNVRVLSWKGDHYNAMDDLVHRLGSNPKASSWAIKADGSPASAKKGKGVQHLKFLGNETTGRSLLASGNVTNTGEVKWNTWSSTYDRKIYTTTTAWVKALGYDRKVKSPKSIKSKDGSWKIDYLPGGPDNRAKEVAAVNCDAYTLHGKKVRPTIEVVMMIWNDSRKEVAIEAGKKKRQGCYVRLVIASEQTEPDVLKAIRKYDIDTRDTSFAEVKDHAKVILIRSKKVNEVITGSANLGGSSYNTNAIVTIKSLAEVEQTMRWFDLVHRESKVWR